MKRLRNWRKTTKYLLAGFLVFVIAVFLNNTSLLVERGAGSPTLLAHRGIAQQFHRENLRNDTCTATRMVTPTHAYLENTIDSMRASFEAGADILEFDIHPTTDDRFAVFHDWTLECRTDGRGVTREHSMAALKRLDIGYGYTADGGKTFPFRGKGIGFMPALDEVFTTFPEQRFLINIKSNDPAEGRMLAAALRESPPSRLARLMVYGGDRPVAILRQEMQGIRTMSKKTLRDCLFGYIGYGWTGIVPTACAGSVIFVPINIAPWLWGWPDRFLQRMTDAGSEVYVIGPYTGGDFSTGIDSPEDLRRLPQGFAGGIMTNEIETIAPLLRKISPRRLR